MDRRHTASRPDATVIVTAMDTGQSSERDTLMCVHCGKHWIVQPGCGRRRNYCTYHNGPLCGAETCDYCQRMDVGMQFDELPDFVFTNSEQAFELKSALKQHKEIGIILPKPKVLNVESGG